jgi:hypothetical protein
MVKGTKSEYISVADILARTSGGYDVYMYYEGKVAKNMKIPWETDNHPSFGIFPYNGAYVWKDMANEESGNVISFVAKKFGLDYADARDKILHDFGFGGKKINTSPVIVTWDKPDEEKEYCQIEFTPQPFKKEHHEYWNRAGVSEEHCNRFNCWAVRNIAIKSKEWRNIPIKRNEPVFVYYSTEENGKKIYFPYREHGKRFRNNVSYRHLWNYARVGDCEKLIIQKSMKDLIVTTMIFPCVIAVQAEAVKIFNEEVVGRINNITKSPCVFFGSDWDGVKKCKEITDTNKWKYINTPKNLLPEINDAYGFSCKFGLRELENFMKLKKVI